MTDVLQRLYSSVDGAVEDLKAMSNGQPDAKIGSAAAQTFNAVLKETKKVVRTPLVAEMEELNDQDPFLALVLRLRVLKSELAAVAFRG